MEETMKATTVREEATETVVSEAGATVATTCTEHTRLDKMAKRILNVIGTDCEAEAPAIPETVSNHFLSYDIYVASN